MRLRGADRLHQEASPNSASTWRHAPHGDAGGSVSLTTTMRRNWRAPARDRGGHDAARSAQMVSP